MNVGDVSLQAFGGPRNIAIRLPLPPGDDAAVQATVKRVQAEIAEEYPGVSFRRVESVSGKVSGELIQDGILAVLFAMIGIAIYSWFRFEWHFRSEEHTSELQSLMRISYAVFCLKKKKKQNSNTSDNTSIIDSH